MPKVAHLVCTYPPYQGGIGNTCYFEAKYLSRLNCEVTVLTPEYYIKDKKQKIKATVAESEHKIVYLKPWLRYGNAAWTPQVLCQLKKFDIVHLHWPFIGGAEAALYWKLFHPKKKLIVQYQMDLIGHNIFRPIFKIYVWLWLPLMVKLADKIIVSTLDYAQKSQLKRFFNNYYDKFIEIPLGVEAECFYLHDKDFNILSKYNLSLFDRIILFVGGLDRAHYFKGVNILIQAVATLLKKKNESIKLLIVGKGNLKSSYKELARELGVYQHIVFADSVTNKELPEYYNLADVFVLPSIDQSESFGLVVLNAMASAKPVVVSNLPGPRSLVRNNYNGLQVIPGSADDLAEKLDFLINNPSLAQEWGRNGRLMIEEKYSWQKIAEEIAEVYAHLK
ncbi:MAG: glycosyltransferase family 4 protein [Patescibacteria group bacterium]|nr:glycosyltransferase family 4 protein [Patescibacteria group bacterium]MDD5121448.1 glycosyltransferase family 4 protein [Patescibacteria group bacterium]MDD5222175.1 glycosyltransferase family 4 protein [Patescibacteria group bacterium]MDD5396390.1 glycosyltransferase family 4 protein [Patescibacteria group bacterium]